MMKNTIIKYWIEKAHEDIGSALDNFSAGRLQNAVRDAYFACFHAVMIGFLIIAKKRITAH